MLKSIALMIAFLSSLLLAESSAWQVSKGAQSSRIDGTYHTLGTADYPQVTHSRCLLRPNSVRNRSNAPNLRVLNPCIFFVQSLAA